MKVKFYGVRGSYPVPGASTIKYGGNTTCVAFENNVGRLIIDSGTGIIQLGKEIIGNFFAKKESLDNIHILFTHLHPDHTQGFPFFAPNYFKGCTINLYGMQTLKKHVGKVIAESMYPPNFPIEYRDLKSTRNHTIVTDGDILDINGFSVKVMQAFAPSHPQQGAIYYKVTDDETGKSVACIWDNESKAGGDMAVINFAKDCDLMIHDAQYTQEEYTNPQMIVQGFGHSTYDMAIQNANAANIEKLVCIHFNPAHDDAKLDVIQEQIDVNVTLAIEGTEIEI